MGKKRQTQGTVSSAPSQGKSVLPKPSLSLQAMRPPELTQQRDEWGDLATSWL